MQVARLTKALSHADHKLEQGDMKAFAPYLKILAALDRYHGLDGRGLPLRPAQVDDVLTPPPLALPNPASSDEAAEVADFGA